MSIRCTMILLSAAMPLWAAPPSIRSLTPKMRQRIDEAALNRSFDARENEDADTIGGVVAWLLSQLHLSTTEEQRASNLAHQKVLTKYRGKTLKPTEKVTQVLQRLTKELPAHQKPFDAKVTILKSNRPLSFTVGGGHIYLSDSLLNAVQDNESALAFLLAHELGHLGCGHCRRGYQLKKLQAELGEDNPFGLDLKSLPKILETGFGPASELIPFLYSHNQEYVADRFALQLCRNAGYKEDDILDGARWFILNEHPKLLTSTTHRPTKRNDSLLDHFFKAHPDSLLRMKMLIMERDGLVRNSKRFGLLEWNPRSFQWTRCGDLSLKRLDRSIVLVHGMHGDKGSFTDLIVHLKQNRKLRNRPILVFRHPANGSLALSGRFLKKEIQRTALPAAKTIFICHSAGGLATRWYAEKENGLFDRLIFLATPHGGSSLTALKVLADLNKSLENIGNIGPLDSLARIVEDGNGALTEDLHLDSLFLRSLGRQPKAGERYHNFYGKALTGFVGKLARAALDFAMPAIKEALKKDFADGIPSKLLRETVTQAIENLRAPDEILDGDLVVSTASARLLGRLGSQRMMEGLDHDTIKVDREALNAVVEILLK